MPKAHPEFFAQIRRAAARERRAERRGQPRLNRREREQRLWVVMSRYDLLFGGHTWSAAQIPPADTRARAVEQLATMRARFPGMHFRVTCWRRTL